MPPPINILTIVTDQQRADTIGALGNAKIRTPVLDRLVEQGVSFTRAYTPTPVCMAARAALATGLSPAQTGCWDNNPMPVDATSYMQLLQTAGYQTHGVGKMHFEPDHTRLWGYDTRDISEEGKSGDFDRFLKDNGYGHVLSPHGIRGEMYYLPQPSQLPSHLHESHWVADRCIDFLKSRDRDRPFLLDAHFIKPHPPFENPMPWSYLYRTKDMAPPYRPENYTDFHSRINLVQNRYKYKDQACEDELTWRTTKAAYYGAISFIDYQVGRILEALGDEIENTLIIFTSDHGEMMGDYGCAGKRCLLEASNRIPFIMKMPGQEKAGTRIQTPVTLTDIFTTVSKIAEVTPSDTYGPRSGSDLFDIARGDEEGRIVHTQFQHAWMGNYMATDGKRKFLYSAADDKSWSFTIDDSLRDTPDSSQATSKLGEQAIEHFAKFPKTQAVENGNWRKHEPMPWPEDRDYGLLQQDPEGIEEMLDTIKPYHSGEHPAWDASYGAIFDHMPEMDEES
ncbi:sulfatase family protein [Pelagicoccus mobilis]|uniref:Sulfatase-like hydrolase/transferase n=1 Tax=Pelagicoccus mobilis TaxID=415221 RepID=A0A934RXR6_9BACT|nr:sulfatase-like hydrolase/transferase [Pelagicoccus mobilis]MBK1875493.1 sulfatase-like hydrolase/transferase [Pelagicoccus mobilis]